MPDLMALDHGPCWQCGAKTIWQCDFGYEYGGTAQCHRWVCDNHGAIEAQAWDIHGWDGVDIRCMEHRAGSFDKRDLRRGQYLPPTQGEKTAPARVSLMTRHLSHRP